MTEEQQIKALAELDGWKRTPEFDYTIFSPFYAAGSTCEMWRHDGELKSNLPNYLHSYDAIIPLIQKQTYSVVAFVHDSLCDMNDTKYFLSSFTPSELCEALLRATGKWVESSYPPAWFTFGQAHEHVLNGIVYDRNCVVKITAPDPRARMFELFGSKWGHQYDEEPDMAFYPRGVIELT